MFSNGLLQIRELSAHFELQKVFRLHLEILVHNWRYEFEFPRTELRLQLEL